MHHVIAVFASLASLGLICAIYYCTLRARPGSWLRSELIAMIQISLFTCLLPLALAAALVGLWEAFSGGISVAAVLSSGADLASLGASLVTMLIFRALVKATFSRHSGPTNITPLVPKSPSPAPTASRVRKAA